MKAAIDIGTNTVLLLVAEYENGVIKNVHEEHRVPRLGKGVDADKNINEEATERVINALSAYRKILAADFPKVDQIIVTATSAVRDANNRKAFINRVKEETGFDIRLLSGREEAECTAAGALSVLENIEDEETLILDIGGGSTEVALVKEGKVTDGHSFDMGSVRFTERFLSGNPPSSKEIEACRNKVTGFYKSREFEVGEEVKAVGVAGTVTTLAAMVLNITNYEPDKLNGHSLTLESVQNCIKDFSENTHEDMLAQNPVFLKGREDIFLGGMLILEGFLKHFNFEEIVVSTGGIRHGAIITLAK
ncbi:Ppx/GppA phosphatase family protein [Gracilimonas sp. BCB1]|uniref:Ppx/GppA phosphatase family protein n=1 Tax=Gracilimonas sp. BCB1 TaxID=3152362 RepID=UPI0032D8CE36